MQTTQLYRPTVAEAQAEAAASSDTHWTATLSRIGMTRISRSILTASAAACRK